MDEELEAQNRERIVKLEALVGLGKWMITICVTATWSLMLVMWHLGIWFYDHFDAVKAGIKAYLSTKDTG